MAPLLDIFRFDSELGHFIIFGQAWTINVQSILSGTSADAALQIFLRVLLPGMAFVGISGLLIWKFGRIYCGWLCPHFSVVEMFNALMLKQLNTLTVWEKPLVTKTGVTPKIIIAIPSIIMAFIWAVSLLTYLMPPKALLIDLIHFELGLKSAIFVIVATIVFSLDFIFARHLFCKYGCALGLFQSLIWMANKKAMIIKFDRKRAKACRECSLNTPEKPCDAACPMRLPTRNMKRAKFTCTQCGECSSACSTVQKDNPDGGLLQWISGEEAIEIDRPAPPMKIEKDDIIDCKKL